MAYIVDRVGIRDAFADSRRRLAVFRSGPTGSRQGQIVLAQYLGLADPETGGSFTIKKYSSEKRLDPETAWRSVVVLRYGTMGRTMCDGLARDV